MRFRVIGLLAFGSWLLALPASAQLDSAALRAKFGAPLNRETFRVRIGMDIVVDYGANQQVCSIEFPALSSQKDTEEFLAGLVPDSMRGKELGRMASQNGLAWASFIEYEHVTISETGHGDTRDRTTVRFKTEGCKP
jgi:hypothetical protein